MKKINRFLRHSEITHTILSVLLLVVVAAVLIISILLVRNKLLQNTHELGMALAQSYAVEENVIRDSLRNTALLAGQYVNEISASGGTPEQIQNWLQSYFGKLTDIIGPGVVDPYVVIDGKLIGANPWEGDDGYNYADTIWYQQAMDHTEGPVFSPVYTDAVTGQLVTTVSVALSRPGDVLAMDIYVENSNLHNTVNTLPEGFSYYLCDENGTLLYARNEWGSDVQQLQSFASYLVSGIRDGSLLAYDAFFKDPSGAQRGAYCDVMDNGWYVIITIPLEYILIGDQNLVIYGMAAVSLFLFGLLSFMTVQDALNLRRIKKVNNTARMLGDSFYAIFRVNFQRGSYEVIKTARDMAGRLPRQGDYPDLLSALCKNVKPESRATFEESFSLQSICDRVSDNIADYGGDYQRSFDGTYRWVNVRTLYAPELAPREVILCFRDVDTEKNQQMQHTQILQDALDLARRSTKAKSEFFSNMSHDMRTPLNAILGFCPLMRKSLDRGDSLQAKDYLSKIEFAGNQLLTLINDILELSRMEAGKVSLQNKAFDLGELVQNTADLFRASAEASHKALEVTTDLRDTRVSGDENLLSQVLNNLLSNAFKYSDAGARIRLEVTQLQYQQTNQYRFVVADTGIGMSKEFLEHLFEPYSRETSFTAHSTVGTGLGMTIVQGLVRQMSGTIQVESTLGEGSCFTVTVPLQQAAPARELPSALPAEPFDWTGLRVLVAEDNALNREILTELLKMSGAEVFPAINGAEAVHTFLNHPAGFIDVILMDMRMPVMGGCQAARILRHLDRPDAATVPIIAVTANAFAEDIEQTAQAGMDEHISKPIDFDHLSQVVQMLLARRQKTTDSP